ncbi:MAG: iron-dependent repressor [Melioribacteraceae bacterium]|nr:MAG: iron-dependent repressor [Melioribacteraceae bacterium]
MHSISKENYLKTVYHSAGGSGEQVATSKLADKLEVSNAATSEMARKLSDAGLVNYARYKGVGLTESGEKIALQVLRRHRLWELFLIEILGMSWGEVHDEAERLEHCTSDTLINKIEEHLEFPKFDPHGSPIPDREGNLPAMPTLIPINQSVAGDTYIISKVVDQSSELINHITSLGIHLNSKIMIVDKLDFDESVRIKIGNEVHSLSKKVSEHIFVSELNNQDKI